MVLVTVLLLNKGRTASSGDKGPPVARINPVDPARLVERSPVPPPVPAPTPTPTPAPVEQAAVKPEEVEPRALPFPASEPAEAPGPAEPVQLASNDPFPPPLEQSPPAPDKVQTDPVMPSPAEAPEAEVAPSVPAQETAEPEATPAPQPSPSPSPIADDPSPTAGGEPSGGTSLPEPREAPTSGTIPEPSEPLPPPTPSEPQGSPEPIVGASSGLPTPSPEPNVESLPSPAEAPVATLPEPITSTEAPARELPPVEAQTSAMPAEESLPGVSEPPASPGAAEPEPAAVPPLDGSMAPATPAEPVAGKEEEPPAPVAPLPSENSPTPSTNEPANRPSNEPASLPPFVSVPVENSAEIPAPAERVSESDPVAPARVAAPEIIAGDWVPLPTAGVVSPRLAENLRSPDSLTRPGPSTPDRVAGGLSLPVNALEDTTRGEVSVAEPEPIAVASKGTEGVDWVPHIVQRGESFWTISQLYYGSARFYKSLHSANLPKVGPLTEPLYVGQTIHIPPPEALDPTLIERARARVSVDASEARQTSGSTAAGLSRAGVKSSASILPTTSEPVESAEEEGADLPGERELALPSRDPFTRREQGRRVAATAEEPGDAPRQTPRRPVYRVRAHETLRSIARETLRDSRRADEIWNLNADVITDPRILTEGQLLELPYDAKVGTRAEK